MLLVKKIMVSELTPGMILAKDVLEEGGNILLLSGFAIKQRYIDRLQSFNVEFVYVLEDQTIPVEELSEEKSVLRSFSHYKKHP